MPKGNKMAWKKDESGALVLSEGNPVYVGNDGNEVVTSGEYVGQLRGEAAANRKELKKMKETLSAFDGIDPSNAKDALAKLKDIDLSKMIDASKLDDVRSEVSKSFQGKIDELTNSLGERDQNIHGLLISNAFKGSQYIKDKTVLPPDVAESFFGKNFKVEDGVAVGYNGADPIYSNQNPGKLAGVDEALEIMVNGYSGKDNILKGSGASGSGAQGSNGNGNQTQTLTSTQKIAAGLAKL
jgi:hypothetical protein